MFDDLLEIKSAMAARMGTHVLGLEIGILADRDGRMAQLEANILSTGSASGKLLTLKQRRLVLGAMLLVRHQVKSGLRNRFARFINVFRHDLTRTGNQCSL
jgi:hypothetical protein